MALISRGKRLRFIGEACVTGKRKRRNSSTFFGTERPNFLYQIVAIFTRHTYVGDDQVGFPALHYLERLFGCRGLVHLSAVLRQGDIHQLTRIRIVADDQYLGSLKYIRQGFAQRILRPGFVVSKPSTRLRRLRGSCRQANDEGRAFAISFTFGGDVSAVHFNEPASDCEAESKPAMRSFFAAVGLTKSLEYVGQKVRRNSLAVIAHRDHCFVFRSAKAHFDSAALMAEFQGV